MLEGPKEQTTSRASTKSLLAASGGQLGLGGLRHWSEALGLVVANQVAIATVVVTMTRALGVPALLATLDLGERFTVHHKSEADSDLAGWNTAAARDGSWWLLSQGRLLDEAVIPSGILSTSIERRTGL